MPWGSCALVSRPRDRTRRGERDAARKRQPRGHGFSGRRSGAEQHSKNGQAGSGIGNPGHSRPVDRPLGNHRDHGLASLARLASLPLLGIVATIGLSATSVASERFQSDEWITECDGGAVAGCSIMAPFRQPNARGGIGSFTLAVDVESGVAAIVGQPTPLTATLQIDKNQRIGCTGPRYCIFAADVARTAASELAAGSVVLIDVATKEGPFHVSLSTKGFHAGIAKIRAWSYPVRGLDRRSSRP
jgi:hypothetical protein